MQNDGQWLVDFRNRIVEMERAPSKLLQQASQHWGAALGAVIRAENATSVVERQRRGQQAQKLFDAGNAFVQEWMQEQENFSSF